MAAHAAECSVVEEFKKALATLRYRLTYEADEWGAEAEGDFSGPVAMIRIGTVMMLRVRYGIAFPQQLVFVTGLDWRADYHIPGPPA